MSPSFHRLPDSSRKPKTIKSAYESETFDNDVKIHVDGLVGSATISPSGRDVALASPEGLAIIDLDYPWSPPRRLSSHGLPWLVVDVQWSPFAARDYWVASTANHRCLVWNLNKREDSASGAIEHSLQGHSRAITDINFSAHHPDSLATCAVDGYVYCWDLRRPRQPALAFCDWFAGATQVKYNRQDPYVIASAHDRWLHIWDIRRTAEPLKTVDAHTSKIYGIDWNRTKATCIVTCSLDKSIKFWDYSQDCETPQRVIRTTFPVWRARHTPFGHGLLAMPQTEPGRLYLYNQHLGPEDPVDGSVLPVTVFPGHDSYKAKEFLWRSRGGVSDGIDNREFQLVSWGEDNELRLYKVDDETLEEVGHYRGKPLLKNLNLTRKGAIYKTFRTVDDTPHHDRRTPTMSGRPGTSGQPRQSALSMGINATIRRSAPTWRTTSMKARTNTGKPVDKTQLQIGWMKGVTMSKRKASGEASGQTTGEDSGLFGPGYDSGWGEQPESIQDEFLRISTQLPNVKWENIDMDSLVLNASLKGPWGVNGETIFIKVRVDIPRKYPKRKAPRFFVEKSSFMPDETHRKLETELEELASRFLQREKNCLYTAFCYLLGEVDLQESTSFFNNVRDLDDDMAGLGDESSSEDENDIPAGGSASMSQELSASTELDPSATLASAQRPAVTPLPMFCGARFSNDGRLVCFFPTKEEKARALFVLPQPEVHKERPKGEPTFAGFGRLAHDSPPPKHRLHDETSATEDASEASDDSESTTSTDSEPTTVHKLSMWYQPGRRFRKTWSANDSIRSSGGGTGAGTGTGTGTSRKRPAKPKNIISIHNLADLLPSKKQFAQEYAVFGDGADVCNHNAAVAEKYGCHELAHVWRYAALLLRRDIPLEVHDLYNSGQPVLVIARDAASRVQGGDNKSTPNLAGRVRWGLHPLARDMINDLFDYFEKIADIQMLAMLACIFGDYSIEEGTALAASHLPQPKTPLPMKAPSFSLEYFPTDPALWGKPHILKSQPSSAITTPRTANTPAMYSDPPSSGEIAGSAEAQSHSYSCGETPPNAAREHLRDSGPTQSLSTSPSNRLFQRSNATVAAATAAIAASLPRALAGIVSSSPPDPVRKKPSPAETMLSSLTPLGHRSSGSGQAPNTPDTARTSLSDDHGSAVDDFLVSVPIDVSFSLENQGEFDDDGWMSAPLIDRSRSHLYSSYRYAYAEMLQMWGQPLSRLEIMKFDVLKEDGLSHPIAPTSLDFSDVILQTNPPFGAGSPTSSFNDRRWHLQEMLSSTHGLDVTGYCRFHPEHPLEPVQYLRLSHRSRPSSAAFLQQQSNNHHPDGHSAPAPVLNSVLGVCHRCTAESVFSNPVPQTTLQCVYCWEPIVGLYTPCLACGCVAHEACLADWHAMGATECIAGHGCLCVDEASSITADSWAGLRDAAEKERIRAAAAASAELLSSSPTDKRSNLQAAGSTSPQKSVSSSVRSRRKSAPAEGARFHLLRSTSNFGGGSGSGSGKTTPSSSQASDTKPAIGGGAELVRTTSRNSSGSSNGNNGSSFRHPRRRGAHGEADRLAQDPAPPSLHSSSRSAGYHDLTASSSISSSSSSSSLATGSATVARGGGGTGGAATIPSLTVTSPTSSSTSSATLTTAGPHHPASPAPRAAAGGGGGAGPSNTTPSSSTASASAATSSLLLAGVKPPPRGEEPVSMAQLSLGKKLKDAEGRPVAGLVRRHSANIGLGGGGSNASGVGSGGRKEGGGGGGSGSGWSRAASGLGLGSGLARGLGRKSVKEEEEEEG
ncbi:hypothetical protein VTJ04DRAFT_2573 [Mycothermus thermophilus]|uniref:uncharacterized protein n=1 Tax=Humicola insolens TaxID=85995 RepID=UPI0037440F1D